MMNRMGYTLKQYGYRNLNTIRRVAAYSGHVAYALIRFQKPIFRERYFKTRSGQWRGRYIFLCLAAIIGGTALAASMNWESVQEKVLPMQEASVPAQTHTAMQKDAVQETHANAEKPEALAGGLPAESAASGVALLDAQSVLAPAIPKPSAVRPQRWSDVVTLAKGGTLGGLLDKANVPSGDAYQAIKAMGKQFDPSAMRPGQEIKLHFLRQSDDTAKFAGMDIKKSGVETVLVRRKADDDSVFEAKTDKKEVFVKRRSAKTKITSSLFADLSKAGVPDGIINQMIKSYSWSVDFQRDIWGKEEVELFYTVRVTDDEEYLRSDQLLYANLKIRGKDSPIYHFTKKDGLDDFFTPKGNSVRKALLQTPVDGARVSSGYGMRKHPVLGYSKMHKGVDFAAPRGTPIYAAGDGTIDKIYHSKSYGKYIRIRHNEKYKTAYAHMHNFAKGMVNGKRVKQGSVIGYVGSTGRSTGPHLHYEVMVNGKQVNPKSVKLPIGDRLKGTNLANFKIKMEKIRKEFESSIDVASASVN